ncbi:purine-nucleoside phosphorylase [Mycoplasma ovis]|uniref:purine-nucleoside phosphorylase n=1 Tax=Mycoplasma ovis TaxID=171632 RepID=UPI001F1F26C0|nr:purine-nucleoside phosphorylase [Mycoplasma ovis]
MHQVPTAHNAAPRGSISKLVIVTGDPLRCKKFSEIYLQNYKLLSSVRNMYCYTGTYKGVEISIMGHGMGQGSMGIYSYELFAPEIYDADFVIRLGSCGSLTNKIHVNDVVVATGIKTNSSYGELLDIHHTKEDTIEVDPFLIELAHKCAKNLNIPLINSLNWSQDNFYIPLTLRGLGEYSGCETVEMESYALATNAKYHNKKALTILTVVDEITEDKGCVELTWQEREQTLNNMFLIGLDILVEYSNLNKS